MEELKNKLVRLLEEMNQLVYDKKEMSKGYSESIKLKKSEIQEVLDLIKEKQSKVSS